MDKPKKQVNLTMVLMTFLTLSIIFSSLAFGYGKIETTKEVNAYWEKNFDYIAMDKGYTKLDTFIPENDFYVMMNTTSNISEGL